jgi:hypothetical protein
MTAPITGIAESFQTQPSRLQIRLMWESEYNTDKSLGFVASPFGGASRSRYEVSTAQRTAILNCALQFIIAAALKR